MTTTRKRPCRPHIGMTIEQAAEYMRSCWGRFQESKDKPDTITDLFGEEAPSIWKYDQHLLREGLRDCGWCLGHSGGFKAMEKAHDLAIQGMDWEWEGHDFSRKIDFAFDGIAGWLA